jgi:RNA polymerase sigma-70 factor (ECF subfamily)
MPYHGRSSGHLLLFPRPTMNRSDWPLSDAPGSTATSLLQRLRTREPAAWERLCRLYGPLVYRWCRSSGLQDTDAADVVQEVFRAVTVSLDRFHHEAPTDSFRGWLWGITRNKLHDQFRAQAAHPAGAGGSDAQQQLLQVPEMPPDSTAGAPKPDAVMAQRALALVQVEFEERTWRAFWRSAVDGLSAKDIAHELGMTPCAVRQAKHRVLRRLRQELDEPGEKMV